MKAIKFQDTSNILLDLNIEEELYALYVIMHITALSYLGMCLMSTEAVEEQH